MTPGGPRSAPAGEDVSSAPIRQRLGFLDALRGLAVIIVLVQHIGELQSPGIREFTANRLQLGQLGVTMFFLCSGFIIPATLERGDSLGGFWISRFFRLYPMYWVSLALALALFALGRPIGLGLSTLDWLAGVTMLQQFLGSPDAVGPYWTLAWEMLFYALMSVLFLLNLHRRSTTLAFLAGAGIALLCLLGILAGWRIPVGSFSLAAMFIGTVFFRWYSGQTTSRMLMSCVAGILVAGLGLLVVNQRNGFVVETESTAALISAWIVAYAFFAVGIIYWRERPPPRLATGVGKISYSVYLIHGVVLASVPVFAPWGISVLIWLALIFAISALTYRWVEKPAIKLGRRYGHRVAPLETTSVGKAPTLTRPAIEKFE